MKILAAVVGVVILAVGVTAYTIYDYGSISETVPADAAIVLGAASWGRQPSPVLRERINHAVTLYRDGLARKIIFTGGPDDARVAKIYALQNGVSARDILVEDQSRTTEEDLLYAKRLGEGNHLTRFLVVSDPLHMKRAMAMAHDLGMEAYASPTPTTRYISARAQLEFLARETAFYLLYLISRPFDANVNSA